MALNIFLHLQKSTIIPFCLFQIQDKRIAPTQCQNVLLQLSLLSLLSISETLDKHRVFWVLLQMAGIWFVLEIWSAQSKKKQQKNRTEQSPVVLSLAKKNRRPGCKTSKFLLCTLFCNQYRWNKMCGLARTVQDFPQLLQMYHSF